jgi:hypothetical protein
MGRSMIYSDNVPRLRSAIECCGGARNYGLTAKARLEVNCDYSAAVRGGLFCPTKERIPHPTVFTSVYPCASIFSRQCPSLT